MAKVTWKLLRKVSETRWDGHYSTTRTVRGRGGARVPAWVSDAVPAPRLADLAEFINRELPGCVATVRQTTSIHGRQMPSGVYYTQSERAGNKLEVTRRGARVLSHDATETYRCNSEVVEWILQQKGGR